MLLSPIEGMRNVTEWAKQPACWRRLAELKVEWPHEWSAELLSGEEHRHLERTAVKEQKILNGIEAQSAVVRAGADLWKQVKRWGADRDLLTQKEMDILDVACAMPRKLPSEKQCLAILKCLRKLRSEGCTLGPGAN